MALHCLQRRLIRANNGTVSQRQWHWPMFVSEKVALSYNPSIQSLSKKMTLTFAMLPLIQRHFSIGELVPLFPLTVPTFVSYMVLFLTSRDFPEMRPFGRVPPPGTIKQAVFSDVAVVEPMMCNAAHAGFVQQQLMLPVRSELRTSLLLG